jgi:hypothetical protein
MRPLGWCHHPIIEIRISGGIPVGFIRANMFVDPWPVNVRPFVEIRGTAVFQGDIH